MRHSFGKFLWIYILPLFFCVACGSDQENANEISRYNKGTIHISCDETFRRVIDEEVKIYEADYADTKIIVHYKPEAECLRDLMVDSIKMVITTRGFTDTEKRLIIDSLKTVPEMAVVARDLIAVVVNKAAEDSMFSMQDIHDIVAGTSKKNLIPVFDGTHATSTVRFMLDSVLHGADLTSKAAAASSSQGVLDYILKDPHAVGFVGYGWIGNSDDSSQQSYREKLRIAWVEAKDSADTYVKPSQFLIYSNTYPMIRDLVYVLKERHDGLAHAFARFLESNRGQLVFRRSYIMPVMKPNYLRDLKIKG
jgi:phosphate transport system substrate-binding protein